jgi:hypothetical protein
MVKYASQHGLAYQQGFDTTLHTALGPPAREFLQRIQRHMVAWKKKGKRVFPQVKVTGLLDAPTRAALETTRPPRPSWQDAFVRIARQDAGNPNAAYYTQGAQRWQGVAAIYGKVVPTAVIPRLRSGDCSAGYTRWVLWGLQQSLRRVPRDVVNGTYWRAGYTGSISTTCKRVRTPQVGDAVLYGRSPYSHVVGIIDVAGKLAVSHGSNAGPNLVRWDYRGDIAGFWRPDTGRA